MQSRPIEFSQSASEHTLSQDSISTQYGQLYRTGSPDPVPAAPGSELQAQEPSVQDAAAEQALPSADGSVFGWRNGNASGVSGQRPGKRTPSPVDRIIEHEKASPKYAPSKESSPGFRVITRSKNAPLPRLSLHDLPAEVLTHVCSYLPADAFSSMSLVSKKIHRIVTEQHAWRMAFARYFPGHEALNEDAAIKLDRAGEEFLASEKRFFTRLTALASWRSEYIIRTRMLRALGRGSPSDIDNLTGHVGSRSSAKASRVSQVDYPGGLETPITRIEGVFNSTNNRSQVRLVHGSHEECRASLSRPLEAKHTPWGVEIAPLQFYEVQPGIEMYGLGPGEVVGVPNSFDISPVFGLMVVDGSPGGRIYHRHVQDERGNYLPRTLNDGAADQGIPQVNSQHESLTAVWIAKTSRISELTNGMIAAFVGASTGIVTACSLGSPGLTGTRITPREVTARWVLSPGVPIIAFGVDENLSSRRLGERKPWAFALNALGEVFYLKDLPVQKRHTDAVRQPSEWDVNATAWENGRSVYWNVVEATRRVAKPDPFGEADVDASYTPRTSSHAHGLSREQTASEIREVENFMQKRPIHFRTICEGWDMQRRLEIDFAGDDENGAGESVFVISCGLQADEKASVRRYTRLLIEDKIHIEQPVSPTRKPSPPLQSNSLFGGYDAEPATQSPWNVTKPQNVRRISDASSEALAAEERFEVWRTSNLSFSGLKSVQISASACDQSTYSNFTVDEDPLLSLNPISNTWSPSASPIGITQRLATATDVPGQRSRLIAVGTAFGTVLVWNMRAPTSLSTELVNDIEPVRVIHTESPGISSLALSALYLVHGGSDGLVQAWDPLASTNAPIRTLHSKFAQKARRDLRQNQARPMGIGINYYAASAICLDPDPKVLRGVASIGTRLRYWSYSSGGADSYRGSKRRSQRDRKFSNQASDPKVTRTGRGALADYIANEQADLERSKREKRKEDERANNRYGLNLLGEGATDDEIMAYATMISEEAHASDEARRMSLSSTNLSSVAGSPGTAAISSSSIVGGFGSEDAQLARSFEGADEQLAEALRRSLRDVDQDVFPEPEPEPEPEDLAFSVRFAKSKRGKKSPKGKSPASAMSPAFASSSRREDDDDLEYALKLSLAEEQSRREIEEQFSTFRKTPSPSGFVSGKGKGKHSS